MVDARVGLVLDNRYRLDAWLAAGGTGVVYRATRLGIDKNVAIKFLHHHGSDSQARRKRFQREAEAMSRLTHANLATIIDFGAHDGVPYLVMEFYEGRSLREALEEGRLRVTRAVNIGLQVLAGLASAHERGVVHRDLKPANVLVTLSLGSDHIKILDFGVAKLLAEEGATEVSVTASGPRGTPQYMSPEQARGKSITPATDLYAVGILLYEMVTGRRPFDGGAGFAVLRSQVEDEPAPPRELVPEISAELEAVILKAMAKEPADRYDSAEQMASALSSVPEVSGRAAKKSKSSWTRLGALSGLLVCVAAGAGWYAAEQRWLDVPGWFPWQPSAVAEGGGEPASVQSPTPTPTATIAPAVDAASPPDSAVPDAAPAFTPPAATVSLGELPVAPILETSVVGTVVGEPFAASFARLVVDGERAELSLAASPPGANPCVATLETSLIVRFPTERLAVKRRIAEKIGDVEWSRSGTRLAVPASMRVRISALDIEAGRANLELRVQGRRTKLRGALAATYCPEPGDLEGRPPVVNGIKWASEPAVGDELPGAAIAGAFGSREFHPHRAILTSSDDGSSVALSFVDSEVDNACTSPRAGEAGVVVTLDAGSLEVDRELAGSSSSKAEIRYEDSLPAVTATVVGLRLEGIDALGVRGRLVVHAADRRRGLFAGAFLAADCRK